MADRPLVCPRCASTHPLDERFCPSCRMPLVYAGSLGVCEPITDRHQRARKIKPQYSRGDLVRVAGARHLAEAELVQGMLLEEGVPSMLRRARGFDVPDFLAAGPRDVMVPASGAQAARDVLLSAELVLEGEGASAGPRPVRLALGLLVALAVVAVVVWIGTQVVS
ncbi:MAG TPA: hypothetical protein VGN69_04575 [Solirubrobacteraceae bacterium]|jgi:hypothetical protein|nr:hypothetical protein [Solirubrobacteraceae bacterium]